MEFPGFPPPLTLNSRSPEETEQLAVELVQGLIGLDRVEVPPDTARSRSLGMNENELVTLRGMGGRFLKTTRVIGLLGPLGAGKTCFVRGLARGLGLDPAVVSSPTFVLCHEYRGSLPLYHFDAYRLSDAADFIRLGVDEYFSSGGLCVVEWSDRVQVALPEEHLEVEFSILPGEARAITFRMCGTQVGP